MKYFFFMIILLILIINYNNKETLINEEQYLYCSDKPGPGTYYRKIKHETKPKLKGFYSDLKTVVNNDKELSHLFQTPLCTTMIDNYKKNYFNDNMVINIENNRFEPIFNPFYEYDKYDTKYNGIDFDESKKKLLLDEKLRLNKSIYDRMD